MKRALFVRHGSTDSNVSGLMRGWSGDPLSALGIRQAECVAARIRTLAPIDAIYASTLARSVQTGEILSSALGVPLNTRDDLRELNLGSFEGRTERELWDYFARESGIVSGAMHDVTFPDGESASLLLARVVGAMRDIGNLNPDGNVLITSHGVFTMVALGLWLEPDLTRWPNYRVDNCSLTEVCFDPAPRLVILNDTAHLQSL